MCFKSCFWRRRYYLSVFHAFTASFSSSQFFVYSLPEHAGQLWERLTRGQSTEQNRVQHLAFAPSRSLSHPLSPLISHWLFIVPSSPPFSLFGGVSINIWRSRAAHWQREPIHPPISLPLLALSLFLSRSVALYVCLLLWKSDRTLRRCWQLTVERTHREGHQRGPTIRLIKDTMAASFSTSPPPHHSFLFWSEFQSLFLKLDCWSDSLITKSFRGDPYSHPLHRPRCSSSTIGGRGIHRLWHDGDLGIGCKLELGVRASGAALLRGSESAQSVQPATDPCAQEAQQHWGQAMGPRPQQAAQTKGFWLTYVHTHTHTQAVVFAL